MLQNIGWGEDYIRVVIGPEREFCTRFLPGFDLVEDQGVVPTGVGRFFQGKRRDISVFMFADEFLDVRV